MRLRPAVQNDLDLLWEFLAMASYEPDVESTKRVSVIAHYLEGWQRPGDFGFVVERDGKAIGAAWARQFGAVGNPFFVSERTPELAVAVDPGMRGQRIGTRLIEALITEAGARGLGLCLNVRDTSPALRLYQRLGFRAIPGCQVPNRAGGDSLGMVLDR